MRYNLLDALDLFVIAVEAGLGLDQAIGTVYKKWDNELATVFGRVLRDMVKRFEVEELRQFVAAIIQADQLSVSVSRILRVQADMIRIKRRQRVQGRYTSVRDWQERAWNNILPIAIVLWLIAPIAGYLLAS